MASTPILDAIPDPDTIRHRLAAVMREQAMLRSMLRLAERKKRDEELRQERRREVANAG